MLAPGLKCNSLYVHELVDSLYCDGSGDPLVVYDVLEGFAEASILGLKLLNRHIFGHGFRGQAAATEAIACLPHSSRLSTPVPSRSLPYRPGWRLIGCGLSCEPVNQDFPDDSLVSAWCLCLFREKPGVSDDFLIVTNPPRVLLPAEDALQELQHFPAVITRLMITVDERKAKPRRPCRAESGISPGRRLGEFSGLLGGDGGTQGGMDPILLSWLGRGGRFGQCARLRQPSGLCNRLSIRCSNGKRGVILAPGTRTT